ncbi:hypothetical protein OBBRIDRAFT_726968, partial [Obba rivulosa]
EAMAECARRLRGHDEDMVRASKEEIDALLVFAGLFSTVLTAFNVETYGLLQASPPPAPDPNTQIFLQMLAQLSILTGNNSAPQPMAQVPQTPVNTQPSASAV